jgi:hypothetical protein
MLCRHPPQCVHEPTIPLSGPSSRPRIPLTNPPTLCRGKSEETWETPYQRTRATHHTGRQARCCTIPTSTKADPRDFSRCRYRTRVEENIYCSPRPTYHRQVLTVRRFLRALCGEKGKNGSVAGPARPTYTTLQGKPWCRRGGNIPFDARNRSGILP